jgi:hypothetical protein
MNKKHLTIGLFVLIITLLSIFLYGCGESKSVGPCGSGDVQCVPDYLVLKTVSVDYQNYLWGTQSNSNNYFWGDLVGASLTETLAPLNSGYYFGVGAYSDKTAFFEKSFSQSGWRKVPTDETLKKEREELIIKEPFTEFYVCNRNLFDIQHLKGDLGLYGDDLTNYIKDQINKMIDDGTLSTKCERKI